MDIQQQLSYSKSNVELIVHLVGRVNGYMPLPVSWLPSGRSNRADGAGALIPPLFVTGTHRDASVTGLGAYRGGRFGLIKDNRRHRNISISHANSQRNLQFSCHEIVSNRTPGSRQRN
jgi:hypothetical protein